MMIRFNFICKCLALCALSVSLASSPFKASAYSINDATNWNRISSFDNYPRKIIDSEDKTFFFVHQHRYQYYASSDVHFAGISGAVFVYDKNNPDAGMVDLQKLADLSGGDIRLFSYNPTYKYMVVNYASGKIDVVDSNYNVTTIEDLANSLLPGSHTTNFITFDINTPDFWVSCNTGFIHVDGNTFKTKNLAQWGNNVNSVCRVGDRYIAIIDDKLYECPGDKSPALLSNFNAIATSVTEPTCLMPLGDNAFGVLAKANNVVASAITTFNFADGNWKSNVKFTDNGIPETGATAIATSQIERTVTRARDGYFIGSKTNSYLLKWAENNAEPECELKKYENYYYGYVFAGSWDFENYWLYQNRGEYYYRSVTGTGTNTKWSARGNFIRPSSPLNCQEMVFRHVPGVGFLSVNDGPRWTFAYNGRVNGCQMALLKDGKWSAISGPYQRPSEPTASSLYGALRNQYPVSDPQGVASDPLHPEIVFLGSMFDGVAAVDMTDGTRTPLIFTTPISDNLKFPTATDLFPVHDGWRGFTGTHVAGFDANNVLWVQRLTQASTDATEKESVQLYYWTPEAREKAYAAWDAKAEGAGWGKLQLHTGYVTIPISYALALKHPKNKNKIAIADASGKRALMVYDHKGTLDDNSDDTIEIYDEYKTSDGIIGRFGRINRIVEDDVTGNIIVCSLFNTVVINPNSKAPNHIVDGNLLSVQKSEGVAETVLESCQTTDACVDEYGRLWVGYINDGVVGISSDRSEVIARYTRDNSPLPSDHTYGLGWNPDTKTLFISTDHGIAEVKPEGTGIVPVSDTKVPFVIPEAVTPDYAGNVAVYNVNSHALLSVKRADNTAVCTLPAATDGIAHWDLLDSNGKRVPTGKYIIYDAAGYMDPVYVNVVK